MRHQLPLPYSSKPGGKINHVMLYIGGGVVIGACGGGRTTFGKNPAAYVQLQRLHYRPIVVCGRLKASARVGG